MKIKKPFSTKGSIVYELPPDKILSGKGLVARNFSRDFGKGVFTVLEHKGRSQAWLAREIDYGVSSVNRIIIGKSRALLDSAMIISKALGFSVEQLIHIGAVQNKSRDSALKFVQELEHGQEIAPENKDTWTLL